MNQKPDDPIGSYQAGAPMRADSSIQEGLAPQDGDSPSSNRVQEEATASPLDACARAFKRHERWVLVVGIALQFTVLLSMVVMGSAKLIGGGF
jgi:hypothetical protein